ncbi:MAG: hypothetical protein KDA85_20490, partial [Planctomycetaceae bacterium]|nr:hypothetical protein [Planctomycetaceae bacterium]
MTTVSQPVICSFESRRAEEMEALIRKYGAVPVIAPSMKELPLEENPAAEQRIREMLAGGIQHIV